MLVTNRATTDIIRTAEYVALIFIVLPPALFLRFVNPLSGRRTHSSDYLHGNPARQPSESASVRNASRRLSDSRAGVCPMGGCLRGIRRWAMQDSNLQPPDEEEPSETLIVIH
jgi:hypothetical protein